jgi:hypothetical protein
MSMKRGCVDELTAV